MNFLQDFLILPEFPTTFTIPLDSVPNGNVIETLWSLALNGSSQLSVVCAQSLERSYLVDGNNLACLCKVLRMERTNEKEIKVILQGLERCRVIFSGNIPTSIQVIASSIPVEPTALHAKLQSITDFIAQQLQQYYPSTIASRFAKVFTTLSPTRLSDILASMLELAAEQKQKLLNLTVIEDRIDYLLSIKDLKLVSSLLPSSNDNSMPMKRRGSSFSSTNDMNNLNERLKSANLPKEALAAAQRELERLRKIPQTSPEYTVSLTYLEWILDLPWSKSSVEQKIDIKLCRNQLDEDHFGLEKVKKRIIEYLAVRSLKNDLKGPIICLCGPPGVGKTSLGKSIAKSLGRKFHRISLGGVRDVAEIKGHRRTYIGSLPGLIIQALKVCQTNNPVILLDEIDKVGSDIVRGDPSSALLEVLDPEQNHRFVDHYLSIPFDLSKILFIATANTLETISAPLLDRMELIPVSGYTIDEKIKIAQKYLIPKLCVSHGIQISQINLSPECLEQVIMEYTREPGVRSLERELAAICRFVAMQVAESETNKNDLQINIETYDKIEQILGVPKYPENDRQLLFERLSRPGVVCGLSYASSGSGQVLLIEAQIMKGKGRLELTGKLGTVIQESVKAALSWLRANYKQLLINIDFHQIDIHVHFPAGAISKDGPSAGIAILCALFSTFLNRPCRSDTAMTGELTLMGSVLPVGGLKEKLMAAHRMGIKRVIVPMANRKQILDELGDKIRSEMEIIHVSTAEQV